MLNVHCGSCATLYGCINRWSSSTTRVSNFFSFNFLCQLFEMLKASFRIQYMMFDCQLHRSKVLAKIESLEALHKLDEIVEASDGIMIARGDLGVEIPLEQIPTVQEEITYRCRKLNKPVIIASQLLESMIEYPTPTRAEVFYFSSTKISQIDIKRVSKNFHHPSILDKIIFFHFTSSILPNMAHSLQIELMGKKTRQ